MTRDVEQFLSRKGKRKKRLKELRRRQNDGIGANGADDKGEQPAGDQDGEPSKKRPNAAKPKVPALQIYLLIHSSFDMSRRVMKLSKTKKMFLTTNKSHELPLALGRYELSAP